MYYLTINRLFASFPVYLPKYSGIHKKKQNKLLELFVTLGLPLKPTFSTSSELLLNLSHQVFC